MRLEDPLICSGRWKGASMITMPDVGCNLAHLGQLDAMIGALDEQIEQLMHPFVRRELISYRILGTGVKFRHVISEIGADPGGLVSRPSIWPRGCGCAGNHESAGAHHEKARRTGTSTCSCPVERVGRRT